jgi:hypothetical protein
MVPTVLFVLNRQLFPEDRWRRHISMALWPSVLGALLCTLFQLLFLDSSDRALQFAGVEVGVATVLAIAASALMRKRLCAKGS